jgi:hypothetical protein
MTFIHRTYQAKAPGRGFQPNWHTVAMAHHLMECLEGRCRPPPCRRRSRKSIACSADHPAFTLGQDPTQRVIRPGFGGQACARLPRGHGERLVNRYRNYASHPLITVGQSAVQSASALDGMLLRHVR